jgi:CRP-like cAMP-binding protein
MIERFQGVEGKRRLRDALLNQVLVKGEPSIADHLIEVATLSEVPTEEVLISQDGEDTDLFFILSGKVRIEANGRLVAVRHSGTHVGEMALIDYKARRSASVIAEETTVVAKVTEPEFTRIADESPVLWRRIAIELCDRLRNRHTFSSVLQAKTCILRNRFNSDWITIRASSANGQTKCSV